VEVYQLLTSWHFTVAEAKHSPCLRLLLSGFCPVTAGFVGVLYQFSTGIDPGRSRIANLSGQFLKMNIKLDPANGQLR
jgi:hypothetical protein